MDKYIKAQTRKKFIATGITAASLLTAFKFFMPKKKKKAETMKMLTQDGKLVEVDMARLFAGKRKKISDDELKTWVTGNKD